MTLRATHRQGQTSFFWFWPLLALLIASLRLLHSKVLWVEEGYPLAAAMGMQAGGWLYRDIWFDKPPVSALLPLLWGAQDGVLLRLAGAAYCLLAAWVAYRFAKQLWGEREGRLAAIMLTAALHFWFPAPLLVLGPDMLLLVPMMLAVQAAWAGQAWRSGAWCGLAMLTNSKAVYLVVLCAAWVGMGAWKVLALAAGSQLLLWPVWGAYWAQVWEWGFGYSRDSFVTQPVLEGLRRLGGWAGFHASLVACAAWHLWREQKMTWRWGLWLLLTLVAVSGGTRFFPRYFLLLLPPMVLLAARGFALLPNRHTMGAVLLLALLPVARFAPGYWEVWQDRHRDLALERDSKAVGEYLRRAAQNRQANQTLLVWGYRPDIYPFSGLAPGTPFLDSQPLTGVLADRHLTSSTSTFPALAETNRARLQPYQPDFIVDGLGKMNPALAIGTQPQLAPWLQQYDLVHETGQSRVYQRKKP